MSSKKLLCPQCEDEILVEKISSPVEVNVKGEMISVQVDLHRCLECGNEIEDPENPQDELDLAYRQYRDRHGLLQPEQIKELRKRYGFTQNELAKLLGFSPASINRYESGKLQEKAQDNTLMLLNDPLKVLELLMANSAEFSTKRCLEITQIIHNELESNPYQSLIKSLELYGESEFTGSVDFDVRKYVSVVQHIIIKCPKESISKTKLNKLLFYSDFGHFKKYKKSITGIPYLKELYGPCPQHFQSLLEMMQAKNYISIREFKEAEMVSVGTQKIEWNFSDSEMKTISNVTQKLGPLKGSELSELSHQEKAWSVPAHKERISYGFAGYLKKG